MTASPVVTVPDELIAELERSVEIVWPETDHAVVALRGLLAERAELKRDAERLEWMIAQDCVIECMNGTVSPIVYRLYWRGDDSAQPEWYPSKRSAIDAAMQS